MFRLAKIFCLSWLLAAQLAHANTVAIIGDSNRSRVARSDVAALRLLGVDDIRLIGPPSFIPDDIPATVYHDVQQGLEGVDVIIVLRVQKQSMQASSFDKDTFHRDYVLDETKLAFANDDAIIMHPGPINRGVELDPEIADGSRSVILEQVTNGVAVRMALLYLIMGGSKP